MITSVSLRKRSIENRDFNRNLAPAANVAKVDDEEKQRRRLKEAFADSADRFRKHARSRKRLFDDVDFHGLPLLVNAETRCLRVFWAVVISFAIAMSTFMSVKIVQYMVITKTVSKYDHLPLHYDPPTNDVGYPTVTVCDAGGRSFLNASKLDEDRITNNAVQYLLVAGPLWALNSGDIPNRSVLDDPKAKAYIQELVANHGSSSNAIGWFLKRYTLACSALFYHCLDSNWQTFDCCAIFAPIVHLHHGICFATRAHQVHKLVPLKAAGIFSNVFVKLRGASIKTWRSPQRNPNLQAFKIYIDNAVEQGVWRQDSVHINAGEWTTIKLHVEHIETETKSECINDGTADAELTCFCALSFSNCMWERRFLKNPEFVDDLPDGCHFPILELTRHGFDWSPEERTTHAHKKGVCWKKGSRECSPSEIRDHVYQFANGPGIFAGIRDWMNKLKVADLGGRQFHCEPLCDRWEYTYSYETPLVEFHDRAYAGFTMMFDEAQYSRIRELPALEWFEYMALIGGIWGLWAGISITSCIQCGVFSFRFFCKTKLTEKGQKKRPSHKDVAESSADVCRY